MNSPNHDSPTQPDDIINQLGQLHVASEEPYLQHQMLGQYRYTNPYQQNNLYNPNNQSAQNSVQGAQNPMLPYHSDPTSPYSPTFTIVQPPFGFGQVPTDLLSPMTTGGGLYDYPGMGEVYLQQQQQAAQQHHQQQQQQRHHHHHQQQHHQNQPQHMMGDRQTGQIQNQGTLGQSHAQGQTSPRQMGQDYRPPYRGGYFGYESINFYYPAAQQERKLPSNNHTRNSRPFGSPTTTSSSTNHHNTTHYGLGLSQNPRLAAQFQNYSGSLYNAGLGFRRRSEHDALGALGMARTGLTGLGGQKIERSQTLENFRANRMSHRWEVQDVIGHIVEFSGDQHGSRFIQQKLETSNLEDRQRIFDEIMPNAYQLMIDVFGNYVVQKMFEFGSQIQKAELAEKMIGHVLELSMQMYGCRVVQKALEHVLNEQRARLTAEIEQHVIECVKSSNANHVIQRLIALGPPASILTAFQGHVHELSSHAYGCRVLQKAFECLPDEAKKPLVQEMHGITALLMEDQFGNYVVQSVIVTCNPEDRDKVIAQIKGNMFKLCRHKFASNVCEKALQYATPKDRDELIRELVDVKPDGTNMCGTLLRDAYGNFPLQTCLAVAEQPLRRELLAMITAVLPSIRHTPVGKRLEAKITQYESEDYANTSSSLIPQANLGDVTTATTSSSTYEENDVSGRTLVGSPVSSESGLGINVGVDSVSDRKSATPQTVVGDMSFEGKGKIGRGGFGTSTKLVPSRTASGGRRSVVESSVEV